MSNLLLIYLQIRLIGRVMKWFAGWTGLCSNLTSSLSDPWKIGSVMVSSWCSSVKHTSRTRFQWYVKSYGMLDSSCLCYSYIELLFQGGDTIFAQLDVWKSYATCNLVSAEYHDMCYANLYFLQSRMIYLVHEVQYMLFTLHFYCDNNSYFTVQIQSLIVIWFILHKGYRRSRTRSTSNFFKRIDWEQLWLEDGYRTIPFHYGWGWPGKSESGSRIHTSDGVVNTASQPATTHSTSICENPTIWWNHGWWRYLKLPPK